jgi:hypothetical protein
VCVAALPPVCEWLSADAAERRGDRDSSRNWLGLQNSTFGQLHHIPVNILTPARRNQYIYARSRLQCPIFSASKKPRSNIKRFITPMEAYKIFHQFIEHGRLMIFARDNRTPP